MAPRRHSSPTHHGANCDGARLGIALSPNRPGHIPVTLPPAPLRGVLETALYVGDLAQSRAFYVDVVGCEVMLDTPRLVALRVAPTSVLLLFKRGASLQSLETPGGVVPGHGASGVQHLALAIDAGALDAWAARLAAANVTIESRVTWQRDSVSLYVRDPDGHSVEFVTPGLWPLG